jgi:hypothetical protein
MAVTAGLRGSRFRRDRWAPPLHRTTITEARTGATVAVVEAMTMRGHVTSDPLLTLLTGSAKL